MNRPTLLLAAYALDQLVGDPESLPHPVRLIGAAIARGETALRRPNQPPATELLAGAALTAAIVASTYTLAAAVLHTTRRRSPLAADAVELLLAWTCLAARNLEQEASSVLRALEADDLPLARQRLSRIVGRDTQHLDAHEISRAVIETVAESASDGVLAPLLYLALGGVPLALAYKAVNTLDSMIGHADARYLYFGKAAARLDDAANLLPARLTALALIAASAITPHADPHTALRIWRRDARQHKSPNAGHPEAAMAGALRTALGGDNTYAGELVPAQRIAPEFPAPTPAQAARSVRLMQTASLLTVLTAAALTFAHRSRRA